MTSKENKDGSRSPVSAASLHPRMAMPSVPRNGVPNCEPDHLPDAVDLHMHGDMLWEELREKIAVGFEALASDMVKNMENVEHTNKDRVKDKEKVEDKKKKKDDVKDKDKAKDKEKDQDKEKEKVKDKQKIKDKDNVFDKGQDRAKEMDKDKEKENVEDCRKKKWSALLGDSQCIENAPWLLSALLRQWASLKGQNYVHIKLRQPQEPRILCWALLLYTQMECRILV